MFEGFSAETVDFLWGIRFNNNREWFTEHKKDYVNYLYTPIKELGKALFEPFSHEAGNILKVSRIYRDARRHYSVPYKESLWACIRKEGDWWSELPCLFFDIFPEGIRYGFVFWKPTVSYMEAFRKHIAADEQAFLQCIEDTQNKTGVPITADVYKRPKEAPSDALAPYFAWKGNICCTREESFGPEVFGPQLLARVEKLLEQLTPLYQYLNRIDNG